MRNLAAQHLLNRPINTTNEKIISYFKKLIIHLTPLGISALVAFITYNSASDLLNTIIGYTLSLMVFLGFLYLLYHSIKLALSPKDRLFEYGEKINGVYETDIFDSAMDYFCMYTLSDISKATLVINNGKKPVGYARGYSAEWFILKTTHLTGMKIEHISNPTHKKYLVKLNEEEAYDLTLHTNDDYI